MSIIVDADKFTKSKFELPESIELEDARKKVVEINSSGQGQATITEDKLQVLQLLVD